VLEQQMLAKLEECILRPQTVEYAIKAFQEQLEKRLDELKEEGLSRSAQKSELRNQKEKFQAQAANIADAIAASGHSSILLKRLGEIESQISAIETQLAENDMPALRVTVAEMREFVFRELLDIRGLLRENVAQTKLTLRKHIRDLVLTLENGPEGPFYQVNGKWEFLPEDKGVLVLVARDGSQSKYTPSADLSFPLSRSLKLFTQAD